MLTITKVTKPEALESDWNALASPGSFYSGHRWNTLVHHTRRNAPVYFTARRGSRVVGILPAYDEPGLDHMYGRRRLFGHARAWNGPSVIVGSVSGYCTDFVLSSELGAADRRNVLRALFGAVFDEFDDAESLHFGYAANASVAAAEALTETTLRQPGPGSWDLPLSFLSFEEYLGSLGHFRRKAAAELTRYRSQFGEIRCLQGMTSTLSSIDSFAQCLERLEVRHDGRISMRWDRYLLRLLDSFPNEVVAFANGPDLDGPVDAFSLGIVWDGTLQMRMYGSRDADRTFEYFNVAFYRPIQYAIERGLSVVSWGVLGDEAKRRRGGIPSDRTHVLIERSSL